MLPTLVGGGEQRISWRKPMSTYEAPAIIELGSVADFTRAFQPQGAADFIGRYRSNGGGGGNGGGTPTS
jgi:hypothetical protein